MNYGANFDQNQEPIPQDLTTLLDFDINDFSDEQIKKISQLDWYIIEGDKSNNIFVSCAELEKEIGGPVDECGVEDCGYSKVTLAKVDDCLKRWNETDGFYHA